MPPDPHAAWGPWGPASVMSHSSNDWSQDASSSAMPGWGCGKGLFSQSTKQLIFGERWISKMAMFRKQFSLSGTILSWLVVYLPLWKIWLRQLGWWHSQYDGKVIIQSCFKPPTSSNNIAIAHGYLYLIYPLKIVISHSKRCSKPPTSIYNVAQNLQFQAHSSWINLIFCQCS